MLTVKQVMEELKKKGTQQTRKILVRHGAPSDLFGVKIADLKVIAKQIKGNQTLAQELFETGNYDAMYLAGLVADGSRMTKSQLESWAKAATCGMISEYAVPWVTVESRHAHDLAIKWINAKRESLACSGWCTYAGIVATTPDEQLDLAEIEELLDRVVDSISQAPNKVRYTMNGFVIAVGAHVQPLLRQAKQAAQAIGVVSVDMGETSCKVPVAAAYIEKIEAMGRIGTKRKTLRC
jgi:3-methyladenine DNA glycosylase AlkD